MKEVPMRLRRGPTEPGPHPASFRRRTWQFGVALVVPLALIAATVRGTVGFSGSSAPLAAVRTTTAKAVGALPVRQSCVASRLPTPGGGKGNATAVSSNGLVVGIATGSTGLTYPVLWDHGKAITIPSQLFGAVPTGVNQDGVVVGTAYGEAQKIPVGWWWAPGRDVQLLSVNSGEVAIPEAINDDGAVVGAIVNDEEQAESEAVDDVERAAYWPSVHGVARTLGPLQGDEGAHAYTISSRGVIGGVSSGANFRPVIWNPSGQPSELRTGGNQAGAVRGFIRGGGPAGEVVLPGSGLQLVQWDAAGQVQPLGSEQVLATLTLGATSIDNLPVAPLSGARAIEAVAVAATAAGQGTQLVGYTVISDGSRFATSWRCI
jgi:uncharacterized membrane protein